MCNTQMQKNKIHGLNVSPLEDKTTPLFIPVSFNRRTSHSVAKECSSHFMVDTKSDALVMSFMVAAPCMNRFVTNDTNVLLTNMDTPR